MSDIRAQRLTGARVLAIKSDPDRIVLEMNGATETHHFIMRIEELTVLAQRFTQDAMLLNAK